MNKLINQAFEKADECFEKLDECMKLLEKGAKQLFKEKIKTGTKIRVKKGSTVYLGNKVYATITSDVEAIVK
jgi:hypothetical protein